jgi:tetratricopeptide (TPR) repeat protein
MGSDWRKLAGGHRAASFDSKVPPPSTAAPAHKNIGNAFRGLKRWDNILAAYDRAPFGPRFDEALENYDRAIDFTPDFSEAFFCGNCLPSWTAQVRH